MGGKGRFGACRGSATSMSIIRLPATQMQIHRAVTKIKIRNRSWRDGQLPPCVPVVSTFFSPGRDLREQHRSCIPSYFSPSFAHVARGVYANTKTHNCNRHVGREGDVRGGQKIWKPKTDLAPAPLENSKRLGPPSIELLQMFIISVIKYYIWQKRSPVSLWRWGHPIYSQNIPIVFH